VKPQEGALPSLPSPPSPLLFAVASKVLTRGFQAGLL
jgi:hypothetical protein